MATELGPYIDDMGLVTLYDISGDEPRPFRVWPVDAREILANEKNEVSSEPAMPQPAKQPKPAAKPRGGAGKRGQSGG